MSCHHLPTTMNTRTAPPSSDPIRKHLETARTQIGNGELREAAQTLNTAQRIWPGDARIYMLAGLMAEKSGNLKGALEAMRKSVAAAPDWGPGLLELARGQAVQGPSPLLRLTRQQADKAPLFCPHPVTGRVTGYQPLIEALAREAKGFLEDECTQDEIRSIYLSAWKDYEQNGFLRGLLRSRMEDKTEEVTTLIRRELLKLADSLTVCLPSTSKPMWTVRANSAPSATSIWKSDGSTSLRMRPCDMCCRTSKKPMTRSTAPKFVAARASSAKQIVKKA